MTNTSTQLPPLTSEDVTIAFQIAGTVPQPDAVAALLATRSSDVRNVRLEDIYVDRRFQRTSNPHKVDRIRQHFHPNGLGFLLLARVTDGQPDKFACIDGQTRYHGITEFTTDVREGRVQGTAPDAIRAEVFDELTPAEAALLFRLRNDQNPVNPWSRDRIAVTEGDALMLTIVEQAEKIGYTVFNDDGDEKGTMSCLTEAKRIVGWGNKHGYPDLLADALNIQAQAFGAVNGDVDLRNTIHPTVLTATADLLWRNRDLVEEELVQVLSAKGIFALQQEAQRIADRNRVRLFKATKIAIVEAYNRGKRGTDKIRA